MKKKYRKELKAGDYRMTEDVLVKINADGTTEETLEFQSSVTPVISGANYVTATDAADL